MPAGLKELQAAPHLRRAPRTDLGALLDSALRMIRRKSLLFLVSDFMSVPGFAIESTDAIGLLESSEM